ncbi:substrate-binding domain-containing protein [Granulicoccus sp. GXG6511]|uniref:substrate-binding domain-containing protein n=1 Tax=Granulicoccus sp. GXG6511 TaxID=3381351 RepID=UPI003D7DF309
MSNSDTRPATPGGTFRTPARKRVFLLVSLALLLAITAGCGVGGRSDEHAGDGEVGGTGTCPEHATVLVDPSLLAVMDKAVNDYGEGLGAGCVPITLVSRPSPVVAEKGLGGADAWIPEARVWQERAQAPDVAEAPAYSIGWSPIVLVAPHAMTDALDGTSLTGDTLVDLITARATFADHGHPEWGRLKLVLPAPAESTIGALGFLSLAHQVAGGQRLPDSPTSATGDQRLMASVQWRTVAEVPPAEVSEHLAPDPSDAPIALGVGPRIGVTTEAVALSQAAQHDLNAWHIDGARSGVRIALIGGGTPQTDGFVRWLSAPEGRSALLDAGLRVGDRAPTAEHLRAIGLPDEGVSEPTPLPPTTMTDAAQAWAAFSHRAATFTVVDGSAWMGDELGDSGVRKIDAITAAATESWSTWPPGSVTGLMTFHTWANGDPAFHEITPLQSTSTPEFLANMADNLHEFEHIRPSGGSPLYEAIWTAYAQMERDYRPGFTNTVIVASSGFNGGSNSTMTADQLIERINASDPSKRINLGLVVLGTDADFATVERIAEQTGNRAWLVREPEDAARVLPEIRFAFSN